MIKNKLGNFVKIRTGKLDANASSVDGEYPFFTCSKEPLKISSFSYDCKCVLVAGNGDLNVKYYKGKFDAYQRTYIIESKDESILDTRYLYWFLFKYVEKLRELSIGGVIKYIKINNLTDPIILLPPIEDQKRIVKILDEADALRQRRKQAIGLLDDYLKSVFLEMFGDPVKNPKRWGVQPLSFFIDKERDISYGIVQRGEYYEGGIPVIRIRDIVNENFDSSVIVKTNPKNSERYLRTILNGGEILLSIRGTVGAVFIAPAISKGWNVSREIAIVPTKNNINSIFLLSFFRSLPIQMVFKGMIKGVAQSGLNLADIRKMEIISPPTDLQNKFAAIVQKTEKLKTSMVYQAEELEINSEALMQKAFKGEL